MRTYTRTLQELKEKIIVSRILIVHSIEGKYTTTIDVEELDKFLNFENSKIQYFNYGFPEETKMIGEGDLQITIMNNIELIHYHGKQNELEEHLWSAGNNKYHRLIILINSENLYLLQEYLDNYSDLLDKQLIIENEDQVFKSIIPAPEQYGKLTTDERRFLEDNVAVNRLVFLSDERKPALMKLYKEGYLEVSHFRNDHLYFSLNNGAAVTRKIEKISRKLYSRWRRNGLLKSISILALCLFAVAIMMRKHSVKFQTISNNIKTMSINHSIELVDKSGTYAVENNPSQLIESYNNYMYTSTLTEHKILEMGGEPGEINNSFLFQVYNAYPDCPAPIPVLKESGFIYLNSNNTAYSNTIFVNSKGQFFDLDLLPEIEEDSEAHIVEIDDFSFENNYKFSKNKEYFIQYNNDSISLKKISEILNPIISFPINSRIVDATISDNGNKIVWIDQNRSVFYYDALIPTKLVEKTNFDLVIDDVINSKLYFLWNDKYLGIHNNTEFKFYSVLESNTDTIFNGNTYANNFYIAGRNKSFLNGDIEFHYKDNDLLAYSAMMRESNRLLVTFNSDPSTQKKPKTFECKLEKKSRARALDFEKNNLFVGYNNDKIYKYNYEEVGDKYRIRDTLIYEGHKSAIVQLLAFPQKEIFGSIANDNELILWDYRGCFIHKYIFDPGSSPIMKNINGELYVHYGGLVKHILLEELTGVWLDDRTYIHGYESKDVNGDYKYYDITMNDTLIFRTNQSKIIKGQLVNDDELYISVDNVGILRKSGKLRPLPEIDNVLIQNHDDIQDYDKLIDIGHVGTGHDYYKIIDVSESDNKYFFVIDNNNVAGFYQLSNDTFDICAGNLNLGKLLKNNTILDELNNHKIDFLIENSEPKYVAILYKKNVFVYNLGGASAELIFTKRFYRDIKNIRLDYFSDESQEAEEIEVYLGLSISSAIKETIEESLFKLETDVDVIKEMHLN